MASIVNDVIYSYSIVHTIGGRYSEKHCKVEQIKIIAANEMFMVLEDCLFTKLEQPSIAQLLILVSKTGSMGQALGIGYFHQSLDALAQ